MRNRNHRERGASAVEMAIVAPFLLILLLGIVEFGFVFGEYNELRHAVREGARYAAVSDRDIDGNSTIDAGDVQATICNALGLGSPNVEIVLTQSGTAIGDVASVQVLLDTESLSGAPIISLFVPDQLENTATFRLEQPAKWSATTFGNLSGGTSAC
ncbi:MAG TPA: TadE/TadG family type IV pilus assembly protein [Acidimicrobiia bacterium]|nr:TadE/TadG family type IV pilus assembly protein [Acidimicrobiia bacterium]